MNTCRIRTSSRSFTDWSRCILPRCTVLVSCLDRHCLVSWVGIILNLNGVQPPRLLLLNLNGGLNPLLILNLNGAQPLHLLILNLNGAQVLILNLNASCPQPEWGAAATFAYSHRLNYLPILNLNGCQVLILNLNGVQPPRLLILNLKRAGCLSST